MAGTFLPWNAKTLLAYGLPVPVPAAPLLLPPPLLLLLPSPPPDSPRCWACWAWRWCVALRFSASCCRSFVVVILVSSAATISIMSPIGISLMSYFIWDSGGSFRRPGPLPVTRSARASD